MLNGLGLFACIQVICLAHSAAAKSISQEIEYVKVEAADDQTEENSYEPYLQGAPVAYFGDANGYTNYESSINDQEMVFTNDLGLNVQIKAGTTPQSLKHQCYGNHFALGKYFGKNPNDAYVRSPTPWNDLYKTYGWQQVTTVLTVTSATIIGVSSQPSIVDQKTLTNNSPYSATFNAAIQDSVTNTVGTSWSQTFGISFEQTFKYEVGFLGTGGGGETKFGFSAQFGSGGSQSTAIMVGSSSSVSVVLGPKQAVEAVLTATRSVMKARITYTATLTGLAAVNYNPTFKDHHFWALDIGGVMRAAGLSNSRQITEDIDIGYCSNGKVLLQKPVALKNLHYN
ncbi:hypothetical protein EMCRGX_G020780 [Ephydatia muelleri]